jgi:hypothetical protein
MQLLRHLFQLLLSFRKYLVLAIVIFVCSGCTYNILFWERNIWTEFDGIFVIEEPDNLDKYASLLPESLNMPKVPMVGMFCADYFDTEHWPITLTKYLTPYLESALFITCEYNGQEGWYCPYMAVTTEAALIGGHRLGYPKILADQIIFNKLEEGWNGSTMVDDVEHLGLQFTIYPLDSVQKYSRAKVDFINGNEVSDLLFTTILLKPPAEGPDVAVFSMSPPPLVKRLPGLVSIQLGGPLEGLIEPGTVTPALYQHFSMRSGQKPSGPVIALTLLGLLGALCVIILVWILRRIKRRRTAQ